MEGEVITMTSTAITEAVTVVMGVVSTVVTTIAGNPLLMALTSVSLVGSAIGIFERLK